MAVYRKVITKQYWFDENFTYSTGVPGPYGWTVKDTSSAGTPTYVYLDGGGLKLLCDNTSEAQVLTLFHNNIEMIDIDELHYIRWYLKVSGIDSATTLVAGVADGQNDTSDTVTTNAWFRMQGSASTTALLTESDDGTRDNDDKATGQTLSSTVKMLEIRFKETALGIQDVRFFVDSTRVTTDTTFNMAAATGDVQPYIQLQKASGTGVPAVTVCGCEYQYSKVIE